MFVTGGFLYVVAVTFMLSLLKCVSSKTAFELSGEGYLEKVLWEVQIRYAFQCAHECSLNDECCSYSVCVRCKLCFIHDQKASENGAISRTEKGWQHYDILTVRQFYFILCFVPFAAKDKDIGYLF